MQEARVGIFEDNPMWQDILGDLVKRGGHQVVTRAISMEEALQVIKGLEEGALDVAIVDGNLSDHDISGRDGAEIARLLHEKLGNVSVIGCSGSNTITGVDYSVSKAGNPREIAEIIKAL